MGHQVMIQLDAGVVARCPGELLLVLDAPVNQQTLRGWNQFKGVVESDKKLQELHLCKDFEKDGPGESR